MIDFTLLKGTVVFGVRPDNVFLVKVNRWFDL
jgi:hypothetical protein